MEKWLAAFGGRRGRFRDAGENFYLMKAKGGKRRGKWLFGTTKKTCSVVSLVGGGRSYLGCSIAINAILRSLG